jgi:hypothetical protein
MLNEYQSACFIKKKKKNDEMNCSLFLIYTFFGLMYNKNKQNAIYDYAG